MIHLDESIFEKSQFEIKSFDERILSESIFDKSLSLQLDFDDSARKATINFYNALQEKADLRESITKFKSTIRHTMRAYLDKSKLMVDAYARSFQKRIDDDKDIIGPNLGGLKRKLTNMPLPHVLFESEDVRYEYTYLMEDKIPNVDYMNTFIDKNIDLDLIDGYKAFTDYRKLEMIEKEYNDLVDYIKSGQCYSKARGYILCKKNTFISAEDFPNELFKIYRNGGEQLSPSVTVDQVKKAIERFDKYSKAVENIRDDFDQFSSRRMKVVMDQLDKLDMIYAKKYFGKDDESFEKWYSMYIALKNEQLIRLTAIHHHCLNAKLDALIRSYIQDRNILVKAIGINKAQDDYVAESFDPYDYTGFLIEEQFNALDIFIEASKITGLNESVSLETLNEAKLDNLKNFLVNISGRISDTINRFVDRVEDLVGINAKFLNENKDKILSNKVFGGSTFSNYYDFSDILTKLNNVTFKPSTSAEIETQAENDRWQDNDDYIKSAVSIAGFTYKEGGEPFKVQLSNFLRGNKQEIKSDTFNAQMRADMYKYLTVEFPAIKKTIDADKNALKTFATSMDTYLATRKSNSNATTTATVTQTSNVTTGTGTPQEANASFTYQDTIDTYFNEVDIKQDENPGDSGVQKSFNGEEKKDDMDKKISNASKSFVKVNTDKLTAKMNIVIEAERQTMKIFKWYVRQYNKQNKENNNNEKENKGNENNDNKSIAGAIK